MMAGLPEGQSAVAGGCISAVKVDVALKLSPVISFTPLKFKLHSDSFKLMLESS